MAAFDAGTSAAKRRRERRLRSWWRHERMSIAAVLATVSHHSYPKVDTKNDAPRGQKKVTSTRVGPAQYYELSSDDGRPTGGERPAALLEPWPQGKTERHDGIAYELVQALDAPVLQTVEQLPNVVQFLRHAVAGGCRAGYRSAQDLASRCSPATFVSRHAAGGTAGGSADDPDSFVSPNTAEH